MSKCSDSEGEETAKTQDKKGRGWGINYPTEKEKTGETQSHRYQWERGSKFSKELLQGLTDTQSDFP